MYWLASRYVSSGSVALLDAARKATASTTTTSTTQPPTLPNQPLAGDLPGSGVLTSFTNGLEGWALIAAVAGMVIGAVIWAFGNYSQNYQQAYNGRRGVLVSGLAALLIGGAPHLVQFFLSKGQKGFLS